MKFSTHRILRDQSEHLAPRFSHATFVARSSSFANGRAERHAHALSTRRPEKIEALPLAQIKAGHPAHVRPVAALMPLKYMTFTDAADMAAFVITYIFATLWRHLISKWH